MAITVGIIGGTGYTGVELVRLLSAHPEVSIEKITSRSESGKRVAELYPSLRNISEIRYQDVDVTELASCDVVFSATPNGVAMQHAPELLSAGVKFIDLAADFRLSDVSVWTNWYGIEHSCPELLKQAVYGLPELARSSIQSARLVANPGCYPTATTLALAPLVENRLIDTTDIVVDAKSGVTGAGRGANVASLFSEVNDSFKAYAASGHRHHPEIQQTLQGLDSESEIGLTFIPHLVPMLRGIHATVYTKPILSDWSLEEMHAAFVDYYSAEAFVDILPLGSHVETRSVRASNVCRVALHKAVGSNRLVVLSVIDNLTKGAAGQAVQNMNLMCGLDECLGVSEIGVMP